MFIRIIKEDLNAKGWVDEPVLAACQLRQGHKPSMLGLITGHALIQVFGPRKSKRLPKSFILAVTPTRVLAFKGIQISDDEDGSNRRIHLREGIRAEFPRSEVSLTGLADGVRSDEGTLVIGDERIPVVRPTLGEAEWQSNEVFGMLAGIFEPEPNRAPVAAFSL